MRLAEVMAYADIPINMRPALTELSSGSMSAVALAATGAAGPHALNLQHLSSGLSSHTDGSDTSRVAGASAGSGVAGGIKATQVELVRGALLGCLKMLRQMSEALGEALSADFPAGCLAVLLCVTCWQPACLVWWVIRQAHCASASFCNAVPLGVCFCCCLSLHAAEHRQISDTEYKQFTDTIIDKLIDAERVTSLVLKDLAAAAAAASSSATLAAVTAATTPTPDEQEAAAYRRYGHAVLDHNFVADAAAEELRERLQQLAKQVVDLQVRTCECTPGSVRGDGAEPDPQRVSCYPCYCTCCLCRCRWHKRTHCCLSWRNTRQLWRPAWDSLVVLMVPMQQQWRQQRWQPGVAATTSRVSSMSSWRLSLPPSKSSWLKPWKSSTHGSWSLQRCVQRSGWRSVHQQVSLLSPCTSSRQLTGWMTNVGGRCESAGQL